MRRLAGCSGVDTAANLYGAPPMSPTRSGQLSLDEVRRIALGAQGLTGKRPTGRIDRRHLRQVFDRVGHIQIDSVNVLVRSQELPLFARLGPHPRSLIPDASNDGELFEFWGHEASHIPTEHHHLYRWKMQRWQEVGMWSELRKIAAERPDYVEEIRRRVEIGGPVVASDFSERVGPKGSWWDWDASKAALEYLFRVGQLSARRRANDFARIYDIPERMIPAEHLNRPDPSPEDGRKGLLMQASRAMGVATLKDLSEYNRQKTAQTKSLVAELVEAGELHEVRVDGWKDLAYLDPNAARPRKLHAATFVSPFDSLCWERRWMEQVFGFFYRIEIYVPEPKRQYGYYVLPFLFGDQLVGRVDLKADRHRSTLMAKAAFGEPGIPAADVVEAMAGELRQMATWLGLEHVEVGRRGDLAAGLAAAVARDQ
jgi:uncharacterized protein